FSLSARTPSFEISWAGHKSGENPAYQALQYCSLWRVCSRRGCFSRSHLATYTKKCTGLKRSPCKGHFTSAANRCSTGHVKNGCSFSGKMHSHENLDRAFAASSARSMRLTRVCVTREGNPFRKWQCVGSWRCRVPPPGSPH